MLENEIEVTLVAPRREALDHARMGQLSQKCGFAPDLHKMVRGTLSTERRAVDWAPYSRLGPARLTDGPVRLTASDNRARAATVCWLRTAWRNSRVREFCWRYALMTTRPSGPTASTTHDLSPLYTHLTV